MSETKTKTKSRKALTIIVDIILVLFLIFAAVVCVLSISSANNGGIPSIFGYSLFNIKTDSMMPSINPGDMIISTTVKNVDDIKEGDVVTYYFNYQDTEGNTYRDLRTHRVLSVDHNDENYGVVIYTKGDNASMVDEPVPAYEAVAVYTGKKIPGGGAALDFLKSRTGIFICLVIPLALFFVYALYKFIRVLLEMKYQKNNVSEVLTDEEKKRIAEEYLKSNYLKDPPTEKKEDAVKPEEKVESASTGEGSADEKEENKQ